MKIEKEIKLYTIEKHPLLGEARSYESQKRLADIFKEKAEKEGLIALQGDCAYILYLNINELCKFIISKLTKKEL